MDEVFVALAGSVQQPIERAGRACCEQITQRGVHRGALVGEAPLGERDLGERVVWFAPVPHPEVEAGEEALRVGFQNVAGSGSGQPESASGEVRHRHRQPETQLCWHVSPTTP